MGRVVRGLPVSTFAASHDRLAPEYLATQERLGCIRPEWRYAWIDDDGAVGARVSYWGMAGADRPSLVDVVVADGRDGPLAAVLGESLAELDVDALDYLAPRPAGGERSPRTEPRVLEATGFVPVAVQHRLAYDREDRPTAPAPAGIELRSVGDVGYHVLVPLIASAQVGSLDRATRDRPPADEVALLRSLDHDPAWWELAVDPTDTAPLAAVMPARTDDGGAVIAFVCVTPAARGRGIARHLLARATAALRGEPSVHRVIADVDEANLPMLRVAAAVGYQAFAARAHYRYTRARR